MKDGNISLQEAPQVCLASAAEVFLLNTIKIFKKTTKTFQKSTMNKVSQISDFYSFVARRKRFD